MKVLSPKLPYILDRLAHLAHDMETVQDINRIFNFSIDDLKLRLPHVAKNETKPCTAFNFPKELR